MCCRAGGLDSGDFLKGKCRDHSGRELLHRDPFVERMLRVEEQCKRALTIERISTLATSRTSIWSATADTGPVLGFQYLQAYRRVVG